MRAIIDALSDIAQRRETTVAAVALAWVGSRAGVTSTILGARTRGHLEANVKALEVRLTPEDIARLDALSAPPMTFIDKIASVADTIIQGGATLNGEAQPLWSGSPPSDDARY